MAQTMINQTENKMNATTELVDLQMDELIDDPQVDKHLAGLNKETLKNVNLM